MRLRSTLKTIGSCLIYLVVGTIGAGSAFYISTQFLAPAKSQVNKPLSKGAKGEETKSPVQGDQQNLEEVPASSENFIEEVQSYLEPFIYDPRGRRDPFSPYVEMQGATIAGDQSVLLPLQRFDLDQLGLVGIIWNVSDPKAMFVDPNQQVHIVGKDERIGRQNGYIAVIREGEVVVVEASQRKGETVYTSRVLTLEQ